MADVTVLHASQSTSGANDWNPRWIDPARRTQARIWWGAQVAAVLLLLTLLIGYVVYLERRPAIVGPAQGSPTAVATAPAIVSPTVAASPAPAENTVPVTFLWQTKGGSRPFGQNTANLSIGSLTVAPDGHLWVADGTHNQFQIFNSDGSFAEAWGTAGSGDGQFNFLRKATGGRFAAVAFAPDGSFYVADTGNSRIQKFDRSRTFLVA